MILRRITDWPARVLPSPFEELESIRRQMDLLTEGLTRSMLRETAAGVFLL